MIKIDLTNWGYDFINEETVDKAGIYPIRYNTRFTVKDWLLGLLNNIGFNL